MKRRFTKYKMIDQKNLLKDDQWPFTISNEKGGELDQFDVLNLDLLFDMDFQI